MPSQYLRQLKFIGNLKSSIQYKNEITSIVNISKSIFQVSDKNGTIKTYNLNQNLQQQKNRSQFEIQKYKLSNQNFATILLSFPSIEKSFFADRLNFINEYDIETNKVIHRWQCNSKIQCLSEIDPYFSSFENTYIVLDRKGQIYIYDNRIEKRINSEIYINQCLGIPQNLLTKNMPFQSFIGTKNGAIIRFDMKMNLFADIFYLHKKDKNLRIKGIYDFHPSTKFKNIQQSQKCLLLVPPSNKNEFYIFDIQNQSIKNFPLVYFYERDSIIEPCDIPSLSYLSRCESLKQVQIEQIRYSQIAYFKMLSSLSNSSNRSLFNINTIKNYFDSNSNLIKYIQSLDVKYQKKQKIFTGSINSLISLPNIHSTMSDQKTSVDNIILTAGDDCNIRFLNFGNNFQNQDIFQKNYGNMDSYHISNKDLLERKFQYFYEGESLLISEQIGKKTQKNSLANVEDSFGLMSSKNSMNVDNGLSVSQNMNFDNKKGVKIQSYGKSLAQNTHKLGIQKIMLMNQNDNTILLSIGKDNIIKIWEQFNFKKLIQKKQQLFCQSKINNQQMIKKKRPASTSYAKTKKSSFINGNKPNLKNKFDQTRKKSSKISQQKNINNIRLNDIGFSPKNKNQIFLNGLSLNQWKTITNFSIAGQSNKKKKNFNVAINHYFNLKSMYRKINSIKAKPSSYSFQNNKTQQKFNKIQNIQKILQQVPQQINYNEIDNEILEAYQRYQLEQQQQQMKTNKKKKRVKSQKIQVRKEIQKEPKKSITKKMKINKSQKIKIQPMKQKKTKKSKKTQKIEEQIYEQQKENEQNIDQNSNQIQENDLSQNSQEKQKEQEIMENNLNFLNKVEEEEQQEVSEISNQQVNFDIEKIKQLLPKLDDMSEENLENFKEQIVELIFCHEIFGEEEFMQFFQAVCEKNSHLDEEKIEQIFNEVKQFLYEQFQEEIQEYENNEEQSFDQLQFKNQ